MNRSPRLFTVDDLYKMVECGILGVQERVELIEGEIVPMSPHDPKHSEALTWCNHLFSKHFGADYLVRVQLPLRLGNLSEPEPDLALLAIADTPGNTAHPTHVPFVLEVASTSLAYDRGEKLKLYARARIPEYWIVNVRDGQVEVYRDPQGDNYGDQFQRSRGEVLELLHLPGRIFPVSTLLGEP
ncbi:MAG: Uma2 family endonuclease [Candidatus Eremiobacteraeota bacterium]|nr:Uma2 family endonuclease [Candidatus Eremiobacteraeota bacterium]